MWRISPKTSRLSDRSHTKQLLPMCSVLHYCWKGIVTFCISESCEESAFCSIHCSTFGSVYQQIGCTVVSLGQDNLHNIWLKINLSFRTSWIFVFHSSNLGFVWKQMDFWKGLVSEKTVLNSHFVQNSTIRGIFHVCVIGLSNEKLLFSLDIHCDVISESN